MKTNFEAASRLFVEAMNNEMARRDREAELQKNREFQRGMQKDEIAARSAEALAERTWRSKFETDMEKIRSTNALKLVDEQGRVSKQNALDIFDAPTDFNGKQVARGILPYLLQDRGYELDSQRFSLQKKAFDRSEEIANALRGFGQNANKIDLKQGPKYNNPLLQAMYDLKVKYPEIFPEAQKLGYTAVLDEISNTSAGAKPEANWTTKFQQFGDEAPLWMQVMGWPSYAKGIGWLFDGGESDKYNAQTKYYQDAKKVTGSMPLVRKITTNNAPYNPRAPFEGR